VVKLPLITPADFLLSVIVVLVVLFLPIIILGIILLLIAFFGRYFHMYDSTRVILGVIGAAIVIVIFGGGPF